MALTRLRSTLAALSRRALRRSPDAKLLRRHPTLHLGPRCVVQRSTLGRYVRLLGDVTLRDAALGDYTIVAEHARLEHATVGRYCSIAPRAFVGLGSHPSREYASTHPIFYIHAPHAGFDLVDRDQFTPYTPTTVGHDVWIGANAAVRDGITIHNGAIVGANAVVTKDVPPYHIVGGVPARLIRPRFDDNTVAFLQRLAWWDRDHDWLRQHAPLFRDITTLRATLDRDV